MLRKHALLARSPIALVIGIVGLLAATVVGSAPSSAAPVDEGAVGRYIVVLEDSVSSPGRVAAQHAQRLDADVAGVYSKALKGYTAELSQADVAQLRADPNVAYVEPDRVLSIQQAGPNAPTGIRRIFAPDNPNIDIDGQDDARIDADVAIIDTGIASHSDLNLVASVNCTSGSCVSGSGDPNGHGTHVAGTVAAIDNGFGVVGVAPGARLHAVRVCGASGSCSSSAIIAGINYVTARAGTIEAANISLGGPGTSSATNQALTNGTNAGVVFAVAAGNSNANAGGFTPANSPDVITVSAMTDSDGQPGGDGGSPSCRPSEQDDVRASFSNFGSTVEVTAPGVCITSTWNNGGYNTISGTSMATPHVAGAAAVAASGPNDPTNRTEALAIRQKIISTGNFGWTDNSGDGVKEPLLDVGDPAEFPGGDEPPPPGDVVFEDDFESATGWATNPNGTDTATTGQWQRGDPAGTSYSGTTLQLGTTTSGSNDLVTGASAGSSVGANDIDGGVTSIQSPLVSLPSGPLSLSARWYLAHLNNATSADFFRISVVSGGTTTQVFQQLGSATNRAGSWGTATANLSQFAGQQVRILIQAADASSGSLVEAGVDDLVITQS